MELKILGETPQEKGKNFEQLMGLVLEKLDFTNIRLDVHETGIEIDIKADHKISQYPLIGECKAHEAKISSGPLTDFLGKHTIEFDKNHQTLGYFFSISGFSGTAWAWYEQNISSGKKSIFKVFDNSKIFSILQTLDLLIPEKQFVEKISNQIPHSLGERYAVYYDSRLFIVQIFRMKDDIERFVVYNGEGNIANQDISKKIKEIDQRLKSIPLVDLEITLKVHLNLMDLQTKTVSEIASQINESEDDVKTSLDDLQLEDLIIEESNAEKKYLLKTNIDSLILSTKKFGNSKNKFDYMNTEFIENQINDDFIDHLISRYHLVLSTERKETIKAASKVFPSFLASILLMNPEAYQNYYEHKQTLNLSEDAEKEFDESLFSGLMLNLLGDIINDIDHLPRGYLPRKNIEGFSQKIDLKFASQEKLIFSIDAGGIHVYQTARGNILAGQIVTADNDALLKSANVEMSLEQHDYAILTYDKLIALNPNNTILKAAWINKGLCYLRKKDCESAEPCFDEALKIDENLIQALSNKALCLEEADDVAGAEKLRNKIKELEEQKENE